MVPLNMDTFRGILTHIGINVAGSKKLFSTVGINWGAATQKPSNIPVIMANSQATGPMKTAFIAEAEVTPLRSIPKGTKVVKDEGKRKLSDKDQLDSDDLFNELSEELSAGTEEGGAGGQGAGAGEEGAGAGGKGFGGDRGAGGKQMVALLKNLDPNKPIQDQINEYLTHPAWKTESGQAKIGEFLATHLNGGNETNDPKLRINVQLHRQSSAEKAALKEIQRDMEGERASPEEQLAIEEDFKQYCAIGTPSEWLEVKNKLEARNLRLDLKEKLIETFRQRLLHKAGIFLRNPNLSTLDDRAAMYDHTSYKTQNAIPHAQKEFRVGVTRIYPHLSPQRTQYREE